MNLQIDPNARPLQSDPKTGDPYLFAIINRERLRRNLHADTYEKDGVLYWKSNDAVVPLHCFRDAQYICPKAQSEARDREIEKFLAKAKSAPVVQPSQEELYEARAAHGTHNEDGTPIILIDVFSGHKFNLATGQRYKV